MHRSGLIELETVLAVARHGSFRAAARQLGMSTSAVSSAVAGLEARLKARLFHRTTRSVALTEAGQRYVQRIAPAMAEIRGAGEEINSQPEAPAGTLRINAPGDAVRMIFEPLLLEYLLRHPRMNLDIVSEARMIDIVADGFDAGIRLAEAVPRDMVSVPLSDDLRMVIVGSPAYFAQHGKPRTPDDLAGHAAIRMRLSHGGLYRWELERRGEALEIDLPPRLVLSDPRTAVQAVRAGIGLAFLSEWHLTDDLANGSLVTVLEEWCPPFPGIRLYYPRHRYVPAGLKALVELIREKNTARRAAR
ncbi:LysR family transcriptional regulator [Cystobacter fuscus]|uniref:LysR family transcriptional regulator n=1 Tax=Cystobacter fuscus TaxID=43 RepID=A0A250J1Q2_9BACT|nr:LysR family transcriptional regulator [Cystobacter fuscus]ATB37905.1 LysR family transcriptional regulator [Cystobacter fuscus]